MRWAKGEALLARRRERAAIFASAAGRRRNPLDSVRRRLILMVVLAITPIAALNMLQGILQLNRASGEAQHRLLQQAVQAASSQQNVFASAETVLQALQNVPDVREVSPACRAVLYGAMLSLPFAANIGVVDKDALPVCTALPATGNTVAATRWWQEVTRLRRFVLSERIVSTVTQGPVIVAAIPLTDERGAFNGALVISIDARWLDNQMRRDSPPAQGIAALYDPDGRELVSNAPAMSQALFRDRDLAHIKGRLEEATDADGEAWSFAVAPVNQEGLVVAYAKPSSELFGWTALTVTASFALPAVILVFTLIAIWLAVDGIVLRWLLYLRRVTAVYAQGHYGFRPTRMDRALSEFRVLGNAIEDMALAVRERDGRLREALAEKTALVREIHHRVKNSLQVVVSLLSLYAATLPPGQSRRRFDELRMRVNALALVHRILYEATEGKQMGSHVAVGELLRELGALMEGAPDRQVTITVATENVHLPTDLAVPLALMMVEIIQAVAKPGAETRLSIACRAAGDALDISVSSPSGGDATAEASHWDLARGFAGQLGGTLTLDRSTGATEVHIDLPGRATPGR